jgi:hypothetical protein
MSNANVYLYLLQGSTIKPLVTLLNITKSKSERETLNNEINDNVSSTPLHLNHNKMFSIERVAQVGVLCTSKYDSLVHIVLGECACSYCICKLVNLESTVS